MQNKNPTVRWMAGAAAHCPVECVHEFGRRVVCEYESSAACVVAAVA